MYVKFLIDRSYKVDLNENDRSCSVFAANLLSSYVSRLLDFCYQFCQQILFDFYCQSVYIW